MTTNNAGRLEFFNPILEDLRQGICERTVNSQEELEHLLSMIFVIGVQELELDDLNSILNVVLGRMKANTDQFPSITLLDYVKHFLEFIRKKHCKQIQTVAVSWPADLRIVIQRLFQTFKIPEEYLTHCFELSSSASKGVGSQWLCMDAKFAVLLASLTSGRLRILTENENQIKLDQLISCLSLLEDLVQCVEDDNSTDYLSDEAATSIGKSCQEAATYLCEFVVELTKKLDCKIHPKMDCLLVIYRFLCAFFSIGGLKIMNQQLLSSALPTLTKICRFCIEQRDFDTAGLLLLSIADFEQLPQEVMDLLLDYLRLIFPSPSSKRGIIQICTVIEELKDRDGWYTSESLTEAHELAETIRDARFMELVEYVRGKVK